MYTVDSTSDYSLVGFLIGMYLSPSKVPVVSLSPKLYFLSFQLLCTDWLKKWMYISFICNIAYITAW